MRMSVFLLAAPLTLAACTSTSVDPTIEAASVPEIDGELSQVRDRIADARKDGLLTRRQAKKLRKETGMIGDMADRYGRDGLSDSEARELQSRSLYLRDAVLAPGQQSDPGVPR